MTRTKLLKKAKKIVTQDRQEQYGDIERNFDRIAALWTAYMGITYFGTAPAFTAQDVAVMMILLKAARIKTGAPNNDNWVDIAGYAAIGAELEDKQ